MSLRALLERIVLSDPFRNRRGESPAMKRADPPMRTLQDLSRARRCCTAPASRWRCPGSSRSRRASRAPRRARAKRRYIALYFPNGTADFWRPTRQPARATPGRCRRSSSRSRRSSRTSAC